LYPSGHTLLHSESPYLKAPTTQVSQVVALAQTLQFSTHDLHCPPVLKYPSIQEA